MYCTHPHERLAPFIHLAGDPEMFECLDCGALLEAVRSGDSLTYVVVQEGDE